MSDDIFKAKPFKYIIYVHNNNTEDYYMDFCIYACEPRNDYLKLTNERFEQICKELNETDLDYSVNCFNINNQNFYGFKYLITIGKGE